MCILFLTFGKKWDDEQKESEKNGTLGMPMADQTDHPERMTEDEDLPFVRACREGNREAFGVLVERHQKRMLNMAYRMLGDYDEACDVVQEAFVSAFRSMDAFREESLFATWLFRIVMNHGRTRLKQIRYRSRREGPSLDDPGNPAGNRSAGGDPVFEAVAGRERDARIQACIGSLDRDQRAFLVLRDIQEFSYDEISGILGIPDGTVRSRLFRARLAMKDCLKKNMGDLL